MISNQLVKTESKFVPTFGENVLRPNQLIKLNLHKISSNPRYTKN